MFGIANLFRLNQHHEQEHYKPKKTLSLKSVFQVNQVPSECGLSHKPNDMVLRLSDPGRLVQSDFAGWDFPPAEFAVLELTDHPMSMLTLSTQAGKQSCSHSLSTKLSARGVCFLRMSEVAANLGGLRLLMAQEPHRQAEYRHLVDS